MVQRIMEIERKETVLPASRRRTKPRGLRLLRNVARYYSIYRKFRTFTLIERDAYVANLYLVDKYLADPALAEGCIVECGTWRGGMAAGMALIGGAAPHYHFFDSFEGLPPTSQEDGTYAKRWQEHRDGTAYFDNCTASYEEFMETISRAGLPAGRLHVHKGFFEATFPRTDVPPIAILRLDADWYQSTMLCLEKFWDRLLPGALVLIDDYYAWEGCRKAVHAFLARRDATEAIQKSHVGKVAYLVKDQRTV